MANEIKTKGTENVPNFEGFFDKMGMRFNPAIPKAGRLKGSQKKPCLEAREFQRRYERWLNTSR